MASASATICFSSLCAKVRIIPRRQTSHVLCLSVASRLVRAYDSQLANTHAPASPLNAQSLALFMARFATAMRSRIRGCSLWHGVHFSLCRIQRIHHCIYFSLLCFPSFSMAFGFALPQRYVCRLRHTSDSPRNGSRLPLTHRQQLGKEGAAQRQALTKKTTRLVQSGIIVRADPRHLALGRLS